MRKQARYILPLSNLGVCCLADGGSTASLVIYRGYVLVITMCNLRFIDCLVCTAAVIFKLIVVGEMCHLTCGVVFALEAIEGQEKIEYTFLWVCHSLFQTYEL